MWFSGQIALGLRGRRCRDLWCVVYCNNVCRLRLSCWCWMCCEAGYSRGILTEKAWIGSGLVNNHQGFLLHYQGQEHRRQNFQNFTIFTVSFFCDNLLLIPFWANLSLHISWKRSLAEHQIHTACFPSTLIPPCLYSSSIQLLFGFSRDSFCTILLSDACCYPTDLCLSWRMAVQFSAWIAVLVALCVF